MLKPYLEEKSDALREAIQEMQQLGYAFRARDIDFIRIVLGSVFAKGSCWQAEHVMQTMVEKFPDVGNNVAKEIKSERGR